MATIYHQIGIKAPVEKIYNALTSLEGVSSWWAPASGACDAGSELVFHFGEHKVTMQVIASVSNLRVVWENIDDEGEWKDTLFTFDLQQDDEQVLVNFTHADWEEVTELFTHCSTKWAVFLLSLKEYVETGTGKPFPNDIAINHTNA